jgi:hypothetical protein
MQRRSDEKGKEEKSENRRATSSHKWVAKASKDVSREKTGKKQSRLQ